MNAAFGPPREGSGPSARGIALRLACLAALLLLPSVARADQGRISPPRLPDVTLFDQDGREVRLAEWIRGRTVAVNFVFTTCTTICSPLTAIFAKVQEQLGSRLGKEVHLLSITLDPAVDTPSRLDAFARKFGRREGWRFVTGKPADVRRVLEAFGAAVADKERHPPMVVVGNEAAGRWSRLYGLSSPAQIAEAIEAVRPAPAADPAAAYFTDLEVVDQHGRPHRFYSDLLAGKKVLLHFAFTGCRTACPPILANLARVQEQLGERMEKEVRILTLTVDPGNDGPAALRETASRVGAKKGWYFLTGTRENMEAILRKLGGYTADPEAHSTALYLGSTASGHWIKSVAMRSAQELAEALVHLDDPLIGAREP